MFSIKGDVMVMFVVVEKDRFELDDTEKRVFSKTYFPNYHYRINHMMFKSKKSNKWHQLSDLVNGDVEVRMKMGDRGMVKNLRKARSLRLNYGSVVVFY